MRWTLWTPRTHFQPMITRPSAPLVACGCIDKRGMVPHKFSPCLVSQKEALAETGGKVAQDPTGVLFQCHNWQTLHLHPFGTVHITLLHIPPDHTSCLIFYGSSEQTSLEGARRAPCVKPTASCSCWLHSLMRNSPLGERVKRLINAPGALFQSSLWCGKETWLVVKQCASIIKYLRN